MPSPAEYSLATQHTLTIGDARDFPHLKDGSVDLVVTSPPYPMIAMWDECFASMNSAVHDAIAAEDGERAFEAMHLELDRVWKECFRVLRPGGYCCINIGDATRSIGGRFRLFSNHARVLESARRCGFDTLPDIIWRKPSNAPNKFMGSGMLPCGAHVTYEHEYILILRKGVPRAFKSPDEKANRRSSAIFWGERNSWFSDLWTDLTGARQALCDPNMRDRSAAFPLELPYRLILMFSVMGDLILDPFMGTGTTAAAALSAGRHSIGFDLEDGMRQLWRDTCKTSVSLGQSRAADRLEQQSDAIVARIAQGKHPRHHNEYYALSVVTGQERDLRIVSPLSADVSSDGGSITSPFDFSPAERAKQGELFNS